MKQDRMPGAVHPRPIPQYPLERGEQNAPKPGSASDATSTAKRTSNGVVDVRFTLLHGPINWINSLSQTVRRNSSAR